MKPKPKREVERGATYASGGKTKMFGTGDRTRTATSDAAGNQTKGQAASKSTNNLKYAAGGKSKVGFTPAMPAKPGRTGPVRKNR